MHSIGVGVDGETGILAGWTMGRCSGHGNGVVTAANLSTVGSSIALEYIGCRCATKGTYCKGKEWIASPVFNEAQ